MKIQLTAITETFPLAYDESGKSNVVIRQARTGDVLALGNLFSKQRRIWDDDEFGEVKMETEWNYEMVKRQRAFLVMVGIDLIDEKGESIFRFTTNDVGEQVLAMSQSEFNMVWDKLPPKLTGEVHEHILRVNPQWNPQTEGES